MSTPSSQSKQAIQKKSMNSKYASPYELYCMGNSMNRDSQTDEGEENDQSENQILLAQQQDQSLESISQRQKHNTSYDQKRGNVKTDIEIHQNELAEKQLNFKKQAMQESTNLYLGKYENQQIKQQDQQKLAYQLPLQITDQQIQDKMNLYYKSNPLNVIPEHWEQESKTSVIQDSQSLKQILSQKELNDQNSQYQKEQVSAPSSHHTTNQKSAASSQKQSFQSSHQNHSLSHHKEKSQSLSTLSKQEKVDAVKSRLKQLFLNYCDFSIDNGTVFITFINFMKIVKDAKILDHQQLNQNAISILVSKECNVTNNIIKSITFEQFLNCILRISEVKFKETHKKHPKKALQKLLKMNILPLIEGIESAVLNQKEDQANSLYSVSEMTLKLIVYNKDTQVIFTDIIPLFKNIYLNYFDQEITSQKGKANDLMKASLKSIMNFTRDFELCPYLIHQKACFLIWYSVAYSESVQEQCNNEIQKVIISANINQGKCFTLGHFLIFIYRLSVIYFNHSNDKAQEFNLVKKLLYFLRKLENSDGFKKFIGRMSRTYSEMLTFLPSKDLLFQILKAEGLEEKQFIGIEESDYVTKEAILSRILDVHLYPAQSAQSFGQYDNPDNIQIQEENEQFLQQSEDELKKLFEIYCSFGEPMNTKYLKSSKLLKIMKDCGLLKGQSRLPRTIMKHIQQISHVDLDLTFKQVLFNKKFQNSGNGTFDSISSMMSMGGGTLLDQSNQISGMMMFQSQLMQSRLGLNKSPTPQQSHQNNLNKTLNFDGHNHLTDKNITQHRLDFTQFKKVIELVSQKIIPEYPQTQAYTDVVRTFLLPLLKKNNDKRCIHNKKIQQILSLLDSEEMINILTILHRSIIDIYKIYADKKGYMNFTQFISFCSDYDIFPYQNTKASLYRIFHSLSFINEVLGNAFSKNSQMMTSQFSAMKSVLSQSQQSNQQTELIDEHLFVEALALCALFNEDSNIPSNEENQESAERKFSEQDEDIAYEKNKINDDDEDSTSEMPTIEKVLQFIEKLSNADGVHKKLKNSRDLSLSIKCSLMDKKDILEPFRTKFSWFFKSRYHSTEKKKNFEDIMEMSSVWTDSSQIEQ